MSASDPPSADLADELSNHLEFVRRMARALVKDDHVAEDVVQETMMAAITHRPDPELGLRTWLASVLRRRVLLHFRTSQRRVARETLVTRQRERDAAGDRGAEGLRALESLERSFMLGRSVSALPEPYRTAIVMRFLDGLAPAEIAERLGRPVNTVHTQLQRGLERLRHTLDDQADGNRRSWVIAFLPHALQGRDGWWPASVGGVGGVSFGLLASGALAVVAVLTATTWAAFFGSRPAPVQLRDVARLNGEVMPSPGSAETLPLSLPDATGSRDEAAAAMSAAATEADSPAPMDQAATFRVEVRTQNGPLKGATVSAAQKPTGESPLRPTQSTVEGPLGLSVAVNSTMLVAPKSDPDDVEPNVLTAVTDESGVAQLPLDFEFGWKVLVRAEGFATQWIRLKAQDQDTERKIQLKPACRLVIDRGTFPLETLVLVELKCLVDGVLRHERLSPGTQELELDGLSAGAWELEALSDSGREVGHWYRNVTVQPAEVARVDLARGGAALTEVEVLGGSDAAEPHFVDAHGPQDEYGRYEWSYLAPIFDGRGTLHGVPPGPAVVRILSGVSEIARRDVEVLGGVERQRIELEILSGAIQLLHPGVASQAVHTRLGYRSDALEGGEVWIARNSVFPGEESSKFVGCAPGQYRLWLFYGGMVKRFDLELEGEVLSVDAGLDLASTSLLRVERGEGLVEGDSIQVELYPGTWQSMNLSDGGLRLSHGEHRIRVGLEGLGYSIREVNVPSDDTVTFAEPAPRRAISVFSPGVEQELWLAIILLDPQLPGAPEQQLVSAVDEDGRGTVSLRPGRYLVKDRAGRSATVDVGEDTDAIELVLR